MSQHHSWEPDPRRTGDWRSMFEQPRDVGPAPASPSPPLPEPTYDDAPLAEPDATASTEYRPWILQRGRSRPAMMIGLRWYEPKAGFWSGIALPYPALQAVEHVGDRMVSLDFGTRKFVIEGRGLDELARHVGEATVAAVVSHNASVWPATPIGPLVQLIRTV